MYSGTVAKYPTHTLPHSICLNVPAFVASLSRPSISYLTFTAVVYLTNANALLCVDCVAILQDEGGENVPIDGRGGGESEMYED